MNKLADEKIEGLRAYSSALVTDALRRLGAKNAWPVNLHPVSPQSPKLVGRVVTLKFSPIFLGQPKRRGQLDIIDELNPGDVLVYAASGTEAWMLGDNVANFALRKKLGGLVVDGSVRDVADLKACPLPIFSRGRSARPYAEEIQLESVNQPCEVGGALVRPGDIMVGDVDGIAIISPGQLDGVMEQLAELSDIDISVSKAIADGKDLNAIKKILSRKHA